MSKRFEDIIQEHSLLESERSLSDAESLYKSRLNNIISTSVMQPYCIPYVEENREQMKMFINSKDFYLEKDFDFYHHSFEEVLEYSVENRGDWKLNINSMEGLFVDEYPAPNENGKVYMVSSNGQHRRLVYHCIGFPIIKATVQKSSETTWGYYWRDYNHCAAKILVWFRELGLIDSISGSNRENTIIIQGKDNLAAWILPDPSSGSLIKMLKEINQRLILIDKAFGPLNHESFSLIRSRFRKLISIELAYYKKRK